MKRIESKIKDLLISQFKEEEFTSCFLVDLQVGTQKIEVFVESDEGITLGKCQKISRYLEAYLDSSIEISSDYVVEVSSPGIGRPIKIERQYPIHLNRTLRIILLNGERVEGKLVEVKDDGLIVEYETLSKVIKKKIKKKENMEIKYSDMTEAKVLATL